MGTPQNQTMSDCGIQSAGLDVIRLGTQDIFVARIHPKSSLTTEISLDQSLGRRVKILTGKPAAARSGAMQWVEFPPPTSVTTSCVDGPDCCAPPTSAAIFLSDFL